MGQDKQLTIKSISMADGYPIEVDQRALDDYLYPFAWRKRRRRAPLSQIPGDKKNPHGVVYQPDTFVQRHPFADPPPRHERHDPYEDLKIPQDHYIRPPQTLQTQTRINNRSALIISAYLAVTLPIAGLILMRAFTTTLLPLDPLYDAVVVFFVACVMANIALVCHNHVKGVKNDMTRIANSATSMEMKEISRTEVLLPTPAHLAALSVHRTAFAEVMAQLTEVTKQSEAQCIETSVVVGIEETVVTIVVEEQQEEQHQQDQPQQVQQPEQQAQPEPQQQQPVPPVGLSRRWPSFRKTSSLQVVTEQTNTHVSMLARFSASMHALIPSGIKPNADSTPKQPAPARVLSSIQNK